MGTLAPGEAACYLTQSEHSPLQTGPPPPGEQEEEQKEEGYVMRDYCYTGFSRGGPATYGSFNALYNAQRKSLQGEDGSPRSGTCPLFAIVDALTGR